MRSCNFSILSMIFFLLPSCHWFLYAYMHTYFLPTPWILSYFRSGWFRRHERSVTGVGNPLDAPKDPSTDLGNLSALFGASQPLLLLPDLYMQRSTKTPPSMHLTGLVASTNEWSLLARSCPNTRLIFCRISLRSFCNWAL